MTITPLSVSNIEPHPYIITTVRAAAVKNSLGRGGIGGGANDESVCESDGEVRICCFWGSALASALVEAGGMREGYVAVLVHWLIARAGHGAEP